MRGICFDYPLEDAAQAKQIGVCIVVMLAYSALLTLGLVLSAPWWLLRMATTERYREGLWQRLGSVPAGLRAAVHGKKTVWVHAVSVGEVLAASRLVAELEGSLGEGWLVVVSTTTRTGQALARQRFGANCVFYVPLDFAWAVRAYLAALKPAVLVLMESEVWPRMVWECERARVPVAVVNARVSDRSFSRGMRVRGLHLWGSVLRRVSLWLAQSEEDARRLVAMGARTEAVQVGGNLKYDVLAPKANWVAESIATIAAGRPLIVAGSTVGAKDFDEERMVLAAWRSRVRTEFEAVLALAPRHPERFKEVEHSAQEYWTLTASELRLGGRCVDPHSNDPFGEARPDVEVIVVDTIGDLSAIYGIADVAFVGGSLVPKGGHNPLEPAQFGVPVLMGPSFENFRDIVGKMQAADGIKIVQDDDELEEALIEMLSDRAAARAMGERGRRVFEQQQGATARAVTAIVELIGEVKH